MNTLDSTAQFQKLSWTSYAASKVGHIRKANEDSFLDAREQGLWVVADGMGGHSRGDLASQIIIEKLIDFKPDTDPETCVNELRERLIEANTLCRKMANGEVMGSTVAAMLSHESLCYFLWAGDSRIYRLRDDVLEQVTEDHSLVQELYRLGELTEDEAENHPSSNVITRAVGVHEKLNLDVLEAPVKPGDRFLLCSDGLFKDVKRDELKKCLSSPSPEQALRDLVKQALDKGGTDNVTAIVVQAGFA